VYVFILFDFWGTTNILKSYLYLAYLIKGNRLRTNVVGC